MIGHDHVAARQVCDRVGWLLVIHAGGFDVDVDAVQQWAADLLLVAGDGYGGIATFFDGGVVEGVGAGVRGAVAAIILYVCCTCHHQR